MVRQHMSLLGLQLTALLLLCGNLLVRWSRRTKWRELNAAPNDGARGHGFDSRRAKLRLARVRANHSQMARQKKRHQGYHEAAAEKVRMTIVRLPYFQSHRARSAAMEEPQPGSAH